MSGLSGTWDLLLWHWAPERAGSVVAVHGLSSCGALAAECVGSEKIEKTKNKYKLLFFNE